MASRNFPFYVTTEVTFTRIPFVSNFGWGTMKSCATSTSETSVS